MLRASLSVVSIFLSRFIIHLRGYDMALEDSGGIGSSVRFTQYSAPRSVLGNIGTSLRFPDNLHCEDDTSHSDGDMIPLPMLHGSDDWLGRPLQEHPLLAGFLIVAT